MKGDLKSALYDDIPLWKVWISVLRSSMPRLLIGLRESDLMVCCEKLWRKRDENLFDVKLRELQTVNRDLLSSNYNLRHQFYMLYAVSLMGGQNTEWLTRMCNEETDENLRKHATLVYSCNVLLESGIDASDVKKAIKGHNKQ